MGQSRIAPFEPSRIWADSIRWSVRNRPLLQTKPTSYPITRKSRRERAWTGAECYERDTLAANIAITPCLGRGTLTGHLVAYAALALWHTQARRLSSLPFGMLAAARDAAPVCRAIYCFYAQPQERLRIVRELGCASLYADHELTQARVAPFRAEGLRMQANRVNEPARARPLLQCGVDMIFMDHTDMIGRDVLS